MCLKGTLLLGDLPYIDARPRPRHKLPPHLDLIPIPDTSEEAAFLCLLLDIGLYPACEVILELKGSPAQGDRAIRPA